MKQKQLSTIRRSIEIDLFLFFTFLPSSGFAPALSKSLMTWSYPIWAAIHKGVAPSNLLLLIIVVAIGVVTAARIRATTLACPFWAAKNRQVAPSCNEMKRKPSVIVCAKPINSRQWNEFSRCVFLPLFIYIYRHELRWTWRHEALGVNTQGQYALVEPTRFSLLFLSLTFRERKWCWFCLFLDLAWNDCCFF